MPQTVDGQPILGNGVTPITGYIVQEIDDNEAGADPNRITDEQGDVITTISGHGQESAHRISIIAKQGTAKPAIGDIIGYTNQSGDDVEFRINALEKAERQTEALAWIASGFSWPAITLPTPP